MCLRTLTYPAAITCSSDAADNLPGLLILQLLLAVFQLLCLLVHSFLQLLLALLDVLNHAGHVTVLI
jgi:hypothetical protein